jgi:two-component system sensor histidine kinase HydH
MRRALPGNRRRGPADKVSGGNAVKARISAAVSSGIAAVLGWVVLSALVFFIAWTMQDRARLIRDNDNERIFNMLFTSLRGYDDFAAAIEATPALAERIQGFAIYGDDLHSLYRWGKAPPVFDEGILGGDSRPNRFGRYTIPDPKGASVKFVLRTGHMPRERMMERRGEDPAPPFHHPFMGKYLYIDTVHSAWRRTQTVSAILLPVVEVVLLFLMFSVRSLYLRNREYRRRIESQKNLVVLGTAAGTLAHEIKNPLLSIRLQTGILEKSLDGKGKEEITLINQEVARLSSLAYRVNDYLREGKGSPVPLNMYDLLAETSRRLFGRNIVKEDSAKDIFVMADADRFRSIFENLMRNALESGGGEKGAGASAERSRGEAVIRVYDRGRGVASSELPRIFDPFFTTKSTGTGIGLSVSRRFVEAAGGTLTLKNREGGGAEAVIVIAEYRGAS